MRMRNVSIIHFPFAYTDTGHLMFNNFDLI